MPRPSDFDLFWKDRMAEADAVGLDYAIETASVDLPAFRPLVYRHVWRAPACQVP